MRPFGSKSEQGKTLQLVQRGTDKRIPMELIKQPTGEVLDPAELEDLSVKVASENGMGIATIPYAIEDGKLVVEVTAEVTRQLGLGVYTLTATGRIPDPAYADGYHDYEIVVDLCKVTKYGSNETPVKVQANVLEALRGASAYEIAVKHGYEGTEEEWIKSLTPKGGAGGGGNGKSAYELAVQEGYQGTLQEWLKSLVGKDGADAYEVAKKAGYTGSREEWLKTLIGATGLSAYQLAKSEGYEGSLTEWIASLKGADGDSAYKVAVRNGYVGDEQAWLESLKGEAGKSAYELAKEAQNFTGTLTDYLASLKGKDGKNAYQSYLETTTDNPKMTEAQYAAINATTTQYLYRINKGKDVPMNEQTLSADQLMELDSHRRNIINALRAKGAQTSDDDGLEALAEKIGALSIYVPIIFRAQQFFDWKDTSFPTMQLSESYRPADLSYCFARNPYLTKLPEVRGIENAANISSLANGCSALTSVSLPDLASAQSASSVFSGCSALEMATIGGIPKATDVSSIFQGCQSLTTATIGGTPKVTTARLMFYGCYSLKSVSLDLSGGDLTTTEYMFSGCSMLADVTGVIDLSRATVTGSMFGSCSSLEEVRIKGLKVDLDLSACANLSTESVKYLVENLQQATGKSITLPRAWQTAHTAEAREYSQKAAAKGFTLNFR